MKNPMSLADRVSGLSLRLRFKNRAGLRRAERAPVAG